MAARRYPIGHWEAAAERDFETDEMCVKLVAKVWSRHLGDVTVRLPADWREAVKERFAPRWVLRRWPVKWTTVDVRAYHAYPDLALYDKRPVLQFDVLRRPDELLDG